MPLFKQSTGTSLCIECDILRESIGTTVDPRRFTQQGRFCPAFV
jgi:hypothetical protein